MLREATELASAGRLLAPPTQPEVADLRRWICSQVREQSARTTTVATPWSSTHAPEDAAPISGGIEEERDAIRLSARALLATDEASVIVAASASALAFLGYPPGRGLEGQRIIRIVPGRYHQAHIAGTTLHMTNGRDPLLGRRVTVPVVKADGTEEPVSLVVRPRTPAQGGRIFVAELFLGTE